MIYSTANDSFIHTSLRYHACHLSTHFPPPRSLSFKSPPLPISSVLWNNFPVLLSFLPCFNPLPSIFKPHTCEILFSIVLSFWLSALYFHPCCGRLHDFFFFSSHHFYTAGKEQEEKGRRAKGFFIEAANGIYISSSVFPHLLPTYA